MHVARVRYIRTSNTGIFVSLCFSASGARRQLVKDGLPMPDILMIDECLPVPVLPVQMLCHVILTGAGVQYLSLLIDGFRFQIQSDGPCGCRRTGT